LFIFSQCHITEKKNKIFSHWFQTFDSYGRTHFFYRSVEQGESENIQFNILCQLQIMKPLLL
jgi:hypothetical protein